jgi:ergothioneine biosynthesis protein EgtB
MSWQPGEQPNRLRRTRDAERMDDLTRPSLTDRYVSVRNYTESLIAALTDEDQCVQSMPDASPAKWHRAHTTWFFEQFVLGPHLRGYQVFDPDFSYLFNSYYEAVGARHARPARGMLTRPPTALVSQYRDHIDAAMARLLPVASTEVAERVELGLQHEQQHQELLVTDMVHAFAQNPLFPAMLPSWQDAPGPAGPARFVDCPGGLVDIGTEAAESFAFDNETPRHRVFLAPYRLADRLVTNGLYAEFVESGGYRTPTLWMSDGWAQVQALGWEAPLYWHLRDGVWLQFGPGGLVPLVPDAPVRHLSWYEADAFARWAGARLPTEAEWEAAERNTALHDMAGRVWQWTNSAYLPYPGFHAAEGAIGEYNGKFMIGQMVLRGSSDATPPRHARPTYRNFFHPDKRWQFAGLRLAKES